MKIVEWTTHLTENLDTSPKVVPFPEIPKNAVPFVIGKFLKFRPEFFYRMESAQTLLKSQGVLIIC